MNLIQYYEPKQEYKVFVRTITYNQAAYIQDTLDGVAMQETDFQFVHFVIDDASTDGEQDIIKSWMNEYCEMANAEYIETSAAHVILASHKTNPNCRYAVYLLKINLYKDREEKQRIYNLWRNHCEYEAICEGDDYWIDKGKLQEQVSFLDEYSDYGLVYTNFSLSNDNKQRGCVRNSIEGNCFPEILTSGINIAACTSMYRLSTLNQCPQYYKQHKWPMGDLPMWIELSVVSKIKYINRITARYRVLEESASHSKDINKNILYQKQKLDLKNFYAQTYGINGYERTFSAQFYECVLKSTYAKSDRKTAFRYLGYALKEGIISKRIVIFFLLSSFPFISKIYNYFKNLF